MNCEYRILFVCGDRSAEIYLGLILDNISKIAPQVKKIVIAGENTKNLADQFVEDLVSYDAHGFFSPFTQLIKFIKLLNKVKKLLLQEKINLVVLLDYYGFNIRIAKLAKKLGLSVIYYITPQVWASRKYRVKKIRKYIDFVINIYPFEQDLFSKNGVKAFYFGHPIVDVLKDVQIIQKDPSLAGIFPGSREQVIKWNLPIMLKILQEYIELGVGKDKKFIIFGFKKYHKLYQHIINKNLKKEYHQNIDFCYSNKDEIRKKIYFAISVSGTVVLENVFYEIPTIVVYNLPLIMYLLIKGIAYVKFISLPNIILNKEVNPEFIKSINPKEVSLYIEKIYADRLYFDNLINEYREIKKILYFSTNVSEQVARKIISYIYEKN